ncbi:hypothetical protein AOLI_G00262290 [Acnodon oligacanthus]
MVLDFFLLKAQPMCTCAPSLRSELPTSDIFYQPQYRDNREREVNREVLVEDLKPRIHLCLLTGHSALKCLEFCLKLPPPNLERHFEAADDPPELLERSGMDLAQRYLPVAIERRGSDRFPLRTTSPTNPCVPLCAVVIGALRWSLRCLGDDVTRLIEPGLNFIFHTARLSAGPDGGKGRFAGQTESVVDRGMACATQWTSHHTGL